MRYAKTFAALAVCGTLAFAGQASAGFTPPGNLTPYLPAANQVTVTKTASFGNVAVYSCSMGGSLSVPASTPLAQVIVKASANCSWTAFLANTTAPGDNANGAVVQSALIWWTSNVYLRYYAPLLNAAAKSAAKTTAPSAPGAAPAARSGAAVRRR